MNKVIISVVAMLLFAYSSYSQFHIELGLNGNISQSDLNNGTGFSIEPKYALNENIDLGLKLGLNVLGTIIVDSDFIATVLPTGTYRFLEGKITPYAGLGLGLYIIESSSVLDVIANGGNSSEEKSKKFGFAPRVGVYLGRLNLGITYNVVPDASYLQVNLGIRILSRG